MELENQFEDEKVNLGVLRKRAYNYRWATLPEDVIALTAADPDFPVAPEIRQAIVDYTQEGVFSYGPAEGLPELRQTISKVLWERKNFRVPESLILPIDSAASAMFLITRWALSPGDEAIIFDPVDFLFKKSVEAAGAKVVLCPMNARTGRIDLEILPHLITQKTRLIGVCNPLNPLGQVLSYAELEAIGTLAVRHRLWIMNDEIWSDIIYPPFKHVNIGTLSPEIGNRTLSVYGFSKTFGLAGLRVGYLVAPHPKIFESLVEFSQVRTTASGVSTLSQIAAIAAFEKAWPWVEGFLSHLQAQRDFAVSFLNQIPGVSCAVPEGTYVLFPDVSSYGLPAKEIAAYLLEKARVAVVPGAPEFFGPGAEGHLRICFSTSRRILQEGLERIKLGLQHLRGSNGNSRFFL